MHGCVWVSSYGHHKPNHRQDGGVAGLMKWGALWPLVCCEHYAGTALPMLSVQGILGSQVPKDHAFILFPSCNVGQMHPMRIIQSSQVPRTLIKAPCTDSRLVSTTSAARHCNCSSLMSHQCRQEHNPLATKTHRSNTGHKCLRCWISDFLSNTVLLGRKQTSRGSADTSDEPAPARVATVESKLQVSAEQYAS